MSDITIQGLTPRQKLLADLIWNCESMDQAQSLVQSLQGQDRWDAGALMICMVHEVQEEQLADYTEEFRRAWQRIIRP
jgi:hypothetical protein